MGEYLQKLAESPHRFSQLRDDVVQRLGNFYTRHPAIRKSKDLIRDYGDMVTALAAGLALTQWGHDLYGQYQLEVLGYGSALSVLGASIKSNEDVRATSFMRNICAGAVPILVGLDILDSNHAKTWASYLFNESMTKLAEAIAISSALGFESERKEAATKEKSELRQLNLPLESIVK